MAVIRLTNRNDTFTDKQSVNTIYGRDGDDRITGSDFDKLFGDNGNDTLRAIGVDGYGSVRAYGGSGSDRIVGSASYGVIVEGGDGNDILDARGGNPIVEGGGGNDQIFMGGYSDGSAFGQAGNDRIKVYAGGENVYGNDGSDTIDARASSYVSSFGGNGNDLIFTANGESSNLSLTKGGFGVDTIECGTGDDELIFDDRDSGIGTSSSTGRDTVRSFEAGSDTLNLSAWDASAAQSGDQAFSVVEGSFTGAGQLAITGGATDKIVKLNTDSDAAAEAEIRVTLAQGSAPLTGDDFVL